MSKIARFTQKIFGYSAGVNQVGVFGSLASGSIAYATDPNNAQSLSNWGVGWFAAIVASNSPAVQDANAVEYVVTSQLAYLGQTGVPEWVNDTTYYIGSVAQDGFGAFFKSLTDGNINHALTDGANWVRGVPGQVPVGGVVATFPNLTGAYTTTATTVADALGYVLCAGQTLADANSPMNGQVVPNINNSVFLQGSNTAGSSGGAATSAALLAHSHVFTSSTVVASSSHAHNFAHNHQWSYTTSAPSHLYSQPTSSASNATYSSSAGVSSVIAATGSTSGSGSNALDANDRALYTTGALNAASGSLGSAVTDVPNSTTTVTGTTNSSGAGSSFSILPPYISAVYLMRVR